MNDLHHFIETGELFDGHYKLLRPLSTEGGTADVWLAIDMNTIDSANELDDDNPYNPVVNEETGMMVAIKIYRPKNGLDIDGEQRFRDEYKIVFNCHHTNLLQPSHFSIFQGMPYLVLPYCENGSSEQFVGHFTDPDELWKYIGDVASGLAFLHAYTPPIIHQDVKPANVLIDDRHNYAITDFGISAKSGNRHEYYYDDGNSGTLAYMAPERFKDNPVPLPESDIWAFGATLCELITGQVPFGEHGGEAQLSEATTPMPDLGGKVPADIERIVIACLDQDPAKRPTAAQLAEAAKVRQFPIKSKLPRILLAAAVALVLLGVAIYFFLPKITDKGDVVQVPVEQTFAEALQLMNSTEAADVSLGLQLMDSLANAQNYIPALYEVAFTYGWYSDSLSLQRKHLLGIEYEKGSEMDESLKYWPKSTLDNNKAIGLLNRIIELNDSNYMAINANALLRMGIYYANTNPIYKKNDEVVAKFWQRAYDCAKQAGDDALVTKIGNYLLMLRQQ